MYGCTSDLASDDFDFAGAQPARVSMPKVRTLLQNSRAERIAGASHGISSSWNEDRRSGTGVPRRERCRQREALNGKVTYRRVRGTFTAGDTINGGYTYKSRFEDGPGSNPEQLIAAAHAACFSMALASILAQAGSPSDSIHTEASVTLRPVEGTPTITKIALVTVGRVPGVDEAKFAEYAETAKAGCPVSRALAGVPEITLEASLVG